MSVLPIDRGYTLPLALGCGLLSGLTQAPLVKRHRALPSFRMIRKEVGSEGGGVLTPPPFCLRIISRPSAREPIRWSGHIRYIVTPINNPHNPH